jgi:hypothetical protein
MVGTAGVRQAFVGHPLRFDAAGAQRVELARHDRVAVVSRGRRYGRQQCDENADEQALLHHRSLPPGFAGCGYYP